MSSSPQQELVAAGSRDYICPCGKSYLSYPALFTHIKQKHDGKAPGEIKKPKPTGRGRGRPPKKAPDSENKNRDSHNRETMVSLPNVSEENSEYRIQFEKIFQYLQRIIFPEEISQRIWDQVYSFRMFEEYIDEKNQGLETKEGVNIGIGLSQFLKDVSVNSQSWKFEQVLVLFMLLLQYVIDECNDPQIIEKGPIDCLVEFMNPFISSHVEDYSQFLGINRLWVMQSQNMHCIFHCFYNWLKWRNYTSFCITLID